MGQKRVYVRRGVVGGGEWGVSHLLRETPPPHSDRTTLSLDSPPPTHLRAAATAAGPRPPALASYCPQHPGPARPPIHKYTHTRSAHTHTHTHTETHRPGRHGVSTSTQRARTRRGPTPRGLRLLYSAPLPFLGSPAPPPSASRLRLPCLLRMRPLCRQGPKIWREGGAWEKRGGNSQRVACRARQSARRCEDETAAHQDWESGERNNKGI